MAAPRWRVPPRVRAARNGGPQNRQPPTTMPATPSAGNKQAAWLPASDYPGNADAGSLPFMDPVMWAALIGVGGSVIVALVGFFTTQHISVVTMRASMSKAHNDRIWDKRAVAYERALAEVANRRVRRERAMLLGPDTMSAAKRLEAYFAARDKPEWSEAEGQLMAYSTPCVQGPGIVA